MKNSNQKGFAPILVIGLIAILLIGGGSYVYTANTNEVALPENADTAAPTVTQSQQNLLPAASAGIVVTSVKPNDLVTLPLSIEGYLDGKGWTANEGEIGTVQIFDGNGKSVSSQEIIRTTSDWLKFPTYFSATAGDRQMMSEIKTGTGTVVIIGNGAKEGETLKSFSIPIRFDRAPQEAMSLTIFVQDKEAVQTRSCGVTVKATYTVPKTPAVADASLKILFEKELAKYGVYKSVSISNGIAKVMLASANTPGGSPIGGLSSCEKTHLLAVLRDTLTQYKTITTVEIHSPEGKIEF